jgi:DNA (cytosine-5)-methyltransferase 1
MRHASLFSGIGGFDLAAEWMGWENVFHCEWMEFPRKVLEYHFPNADSLIDICKTDFKKYANKIDILTGGFPCQPFSMAGKRKGTDDERYLWGEMLRAVQEIKPQFVIAENVFGITNIDGGMVFEQVCLDLEAEGYEVQPFIIPACAKNAPHRRDRVWFIAYNYSIIRGERGQLEPREQSRHGESNEKSNTKVNGNATDTYSGTKRSSRKSRGLKIDRCQNNDESFKWRKPTQFDIGRYKLLRDVTDTDSNGFYQCNGNNEKQSSKRGKYAQCYAEQSNVNGNVTNTGSRGMERYGRRSKIGQFQTNEFNKNNCKRQYRMDWEKFPTEPPICCGNDGLSIKLDGITFSKWRAESIKGYGNAIVPQVAYEIFKQL